MRTPRSDAPSTPERRARGMHDVSTEASRHPAPARHPRRTRPIAREGPGRPESRVRTHAHARDARLAAGRRLQAGAHPWCARAAGGRHAAPGRWEGPRRRVTIARPDHKRARPTDRRCRRWPGMAKATPRALSCGGAAICCAWRLFLALSAPLDLRERGIFVGPRVAGTRRCSVRGRMRPVLLPDEYPPIGGFSSSRTLSVWTAMCSECAHAPPSS